MRVIVTGGSGFIGSNFLWYVVPRHPDYHFLNLDCLTYAANPENLSGLDQSANYAFERADIANLEELRKAVQSFSPDLIVHFAAESHVDRSIHGAGAFIRSNVQGTFHLLELCNELWGRESSGKLFHHVSTDEVFGSLGATGLFTETSPYAPRNPYSATKAASDHLVRAYGNTHNLPFKITNCSNNYGPRQSPEKFIPLTIAQALAQKPIPVYGDGKNVRDWLYVEDHCRAIWQVIEKGRLFETYNVGGGAELDNNTVVHTVCRVLAEETGKRAEDVLSLIVHVADRPGHDQRYAMDASKIEAECGWQPELDFEAGIRNTVRWYLNNPSWLKASQTGDHAAWVAKNYAAR